MGAVKQVFLKALLLPGFPRLLKYLQRDCATVFMLHRFRDTERGISGCDASHLRRALAYLIRNNYEVIALSELFDRLGGKGPQTRGAVAFTIDDGYVEQATTAAQVFAEVDCPVTAFVCTGFLDGKLWLWWDQVEYVFRNAASRSIQVRVGDKMCHYRWENEDQCARARDEFIAECKRVSETEKLAAIADLAETSGVEIPRDPPPHCAPMSWDQVRICEEMGMSFGPHTVTHPVLSRTTDEAADFEINESWNRLRAEVRNPVPIFCYPNGGWDDFGDREIAALGRLGFLGAVTAEPGYANALTLQGGPKNRFRVQRFAFPDRMPHMIQYISGVERLKQLLRDNR